MHFFFNFQIFHFFFPNIEMLSVPNILPSVKFPTFGNISFFPGEKRKTGKSCSMRTALKIRSGSTKNKQGRDKVETAISSMEYAKNRLPAMKGRAGIRWDSVADKVWKGILYTSK